MFASASEHGDSVPPPTGGHEGPYACTEFPPFDANTKSTAYSGSTAISASSAMARPAEMSSCATSAAHDSRNAAPTIARPNSTASRGCGSSEWRKRIATPGTVAAKASVSERRDRPACTSSVGSMSHPTNAPRRPPGRGPPATMRHHGVGRTRRLVRRHPRGRRAVHERRRVDRRGLRPLGGRRGIGPRGRRHGAARDDPAARRDPVGQRGRRGHRHRRDPRRPVHAHDARDGRDRDRRHRVLARRPPPARAEGRCRGCCGRTSGISWSCTRSR